MTTNSQYEEERICKPLNRWPERDRQHWQAALMPGDLLEQGGCRAECSWGSNRTMMRGYGRWLTWLDSRGLLDDQVAPGERITRERVRAYASDLEEKNASATVIDRLVELKVVAAIMDPGRDWSWIYRVAAPIRARHKPARPKRHRLVPVQRLLQLGLDLMANAESEKTTHRRFRVFRDGLMIGLLASRPLRLRNLKGLILDQTLIRRGDLWWIEIPAAATKTKSAIEFAWPEMLVPHLQTYLADHRSAIAALYGSRTGMVSDALWLSTCGTAMSDSGIYRRIVARTHEGLGQPINPHLFRDCAATSIAIDDSAHIGIAARLLGHRTGSTTERYYNQARSVEASRLMQKFLLARRHGVLGVDSTDAIP
jgi:integrase/recombinase XerD